MENQLLARTNNRLIDAFIKAEDTSNERISFSVHGPGLASRLPDGVHLDFTEEVCRHSREQEEGSIDDSSLCGY